MGEWSSGFNFDGIDVGVNGIACAGSISCSTIAASNITSTGDVTGNAATATALATARNIFGISFDGTANVSGDAVNNGHFASVPTGGQAGHFVTLNGTAPTVIAGRSAWYSDSSGNPSFRNGTGSAATLIRTGGAAGTPSSITLTNGTGLPISTGVSGLGTGVATFLATPTSANFMTAVTGGKLTRVFNDETEKLAATPDFAGQLAFQRSPGSLLYANGVETGDWQTPSVSQFSGLGTGVGIFLGTPSGENLATALTTALPATKGGTGLTSLGTGVATFLATPTSANLAAAITNETGSGSLVFATSPTLTTPTLSRSGSGTVFTATDATCNLTMVTDSSGRNFLTSSGITGSYVTATANNEAFVYVNALNNTSGQRVMRFGNLSNRFQIQRLNDANTSITATPFSFANDAATNSFYMSTSGGVGFGTTSDPGAGGIQTAGKIISGNTVRLKGYTFATLPAATQGDTAFITDGVAIPVFMANAAGGGSTVTKVFYNGTNWVNG